MKTFSIGLLALMYTTIGSGQSIYADSKKIDTLFKPTVSRTTGVVILRPQSGKEKDVVEILRDYLPENIFAAATNDSIVFNAIVNAFNGNPFFEISGTVLNNRLPGLSSQKSKSSGSFFSSLGGIDVTNIANGIAEFMIKRAKEELTVAFFNRFKKFADSTPEFKILFPKTTDNLQNLLAYKYPEMLPALRTGFFEDLKAITYHLDDVLELPRYKEMLKAFPEIRVTIRCIRLIHELESGESHAADILTSFAGFSEWQEPLAGKGFKNFGSSVKLAAIFSNSLRKEVTTVSLSDKGTDTLVTTDTVKTRDTIYAKTTRVIKARSGTFVKTTVFSTKKYVSRSNVMANGRIQVTETPVTDTIMSVNESGVMDGGAASQTDTVTTKAWISRKEVNELIEKEVRYKIYLGLIYQLVKKDTIVFYPKNKSEKSFASVLKEQKDNLFLFRNKTTEFIELATKVDNILDTLKEKKANSIALGNDDYYDYVDVSLDVIEYGFSIAKVFDEDIDISQYTKIARQSNELYRNIYKAEYTQAVTNAVDILSEVNKLINERNDSAVDSLLAITNQLPNLKLGTDLFGKVSVENLNKKDIREVNSLLDSSSITDVIKTQLKRLKSGYYFNRFENVLTKIKKYGLFMANMADAETSEEVAKVMENAVLPVGSSSIKKNANFNMAVQSYLGAYVRTNASNTNSNDPWTNKVGVIAPIGISFSHGLKKAGSVSLFGSMLDLGAVVDYKLKKDTTISLPGSDTAIIKEYKIKLGQIFSPGVYLVYGFPYNIPLSLGFGAQFGPGLGKIEPDGNTILNSPKWRWNVFLAVDIPFFNLVNSPKKYKP
jgi:hypothetical protein